MYDSSINKVEQFTEFILFLDFIEDLEISLNFPLQFNVYIEFHDNLLSGGNVVTVLDSVGTINLEVVLSFPINEILEYNNFASHPMLIYFESLNEIKRIEQNQQPTKRNSSIHQTWVCVVDLLPLVYADDGGHTMVNGRYPLKATGELNRNLLSDAAVAGARLNATVTRPDEMSSPSHAMPPLPNNVLNVTVHGLYNPPRLNGNPRRHAAATTCTATLNAPEAIDPDFHSFVFAHGTYTDITRDVNDLRWYSLDNMSATVSATGQRFEEHDAVVVNSAKIPEPKDVLFKGSRYEWNLWQRFLLYENTSQTFQDFIFKCRYMFVEFMFTENPMMTNNTVFPQELNNQASNVNDQVAYIALLDLSMLLQPNCTSVRCLSTVHTLDKNIIKTDELSSANFIPDEFIETIIAVENGRLEKSSISALDVSKGSSTQLVPNSPGDWTSPFVVVDISVSNSFYDGYLKHITTKMLELCIIPEKPLATAPVKSNKYQECLKTTIESLIETSMRINGPAGAEDHCVNELKDSGVYGSMQSLLCNEIRQYIMDNYAGPMIGETIQSYVNRIFVDLMDKMKKTVESFEFSHSSGDDDAETAVKSGNVMIRYAREADELKQTERAKKIYFDLISTAGTRCNPNYWLLYASFCSRRLDFDTALEYVKEVLLVDSGNRIGLFLYAAIQLTIHEDNNNGEIVLKSLVMSHGDFSEVYALLSVHYSTLNMYKASNIMLQRAQITVDKDEFEKNNIIHENLLSWQSIGHNNDPLIKCAILLLELELLGLAVRCLNLVVDHNELFHYYMAVCEYKKGNHLASRLELLKPKLITGKYEKFTDALRYLNNIELNESPDDLENYLLRVHTEEPRKELYLVYLKEALRCYTNKWYSKGAEICQIAGKILRTPMMLTLLAKCLIEIGDMKTAESALNEANTMDVKNEEVWAYLTVVNIKMGNTDNAKVCYTRALEYGLRPEMKKEINILLERR